MNEHKELKWHESTGQALQQSATKVTARGQGVWSFELTNGVALQGIARLDDDWLTMDVGSESKAGPLELQVKDAWRLLKHNASLAGMARTAVSQRGFVELRAETPLSSETDIGSWVERACKELSTGYAQLRKRKAHGNRKPLEFPVPEAEAEGPEDELVTALREGGWKCSTREGGLAVELDVPGMFNQAVLQKVSGEIRAYTDLLTCSAPNDCCLGAMGMYLLRVNRIVRMCRASAAENQDTITIRLEALSDACTEICLVQALQALSVACRFCAAEVRALRNERIAEEYLLNAAHAANKNSKGG